MEKDMVRTLNRLASQLSFNPSGQIDLQTKKKTQYSVQQK
jgi:phage terminase small subunit